MEIDITLGGMRKFGANTKHIVTKLITTKLIKTKLI